jgi:surface antigen
MQNKNFTRTAGLSAAFCLSLACVTSPAMASVDDFVGNWVSTGRNADGITSIDISRNGQGANLQASGECQPRNCNWGNARGTFYDTGNDRNRARDSGAMTATFTAGGSQRFVVIHEARGDQMTVDVYTSFGNRGRQANYVTTTQMRRDRQAGPGPRPRGNQGNQGNQGNRGNRDSQWQQQYGRTYSYNDDVYYQQCRQSPDPAGVIAGALIGGLLGNAIGNGQTGATVAGVVLGGVTGAALTQNLNCDDRSYAYRSYYDGLNAGAPNRSYDWRNQGSGNRGTFNVGQYYEDQGGFRCATYSQAIYVQGRQQSASGHACQQPDGTWTIID